MIGVLPTSLVIQDKEYKIRTDYRVALAILSAYNDCELNNFDKFLLTIEMLYIDIPPKDNYKEAYEKAVWFLNMRDVEYNVKQPKLYDWEQDESFIFSAINKVIGKEIRNEEYCHWWTFLGYFNEISESTFNTLVCLRNKKTKGIKLTKEEQEFYRKNKEIVDLKIHPTTPEEVAQMSELERLINPQ